MLHFLFLTSAPEVEMTEEETEVLRDYDLSKDYYILMLKTMLH